MTSAGEGRTLAFFPSFTVSDATELTDQYYRVMWYTFPVLDRIDRIVIGAEPGLRPGALPDYLDPRIKSLAAEFAAKMSFVPANKLAGEVQRAQHILHWHTSFALPDGLPGVVEDVDRNRNVEECQVYLNLSNKIGESYSYRVAESHANFKAVVAQHKSRKCYIFGTGPNLSLAAEHDYSDGVSVACNSMVKNHALLDRLRPPLIVAGDPIFHAGASIYAAEFRTHLYGSMERYNAHFFTNQRDYRIFYAHMPKHLQDKLIGAPVDWGLGMNMDPTQTFVFTACPNILTLFLIPLAATLGEEIWIAGCDGRPLADNKYFWKHDQSVQFSDKMNDIQRAHPSFFKISYDDYYFLHCATVDHWLRRAERNGRTVVNMTPSFIPALYRRYRNLAEVRPGNGSNEIVPLAARARMQQVFMQRQYRVLRKGYMPRLKHRLTAPLRGLIGG
jgi:hypothetical protein